MLRVTLMFKTNLNQTDSEIDSFIRKRTENIRHGGRPFYEHLKGTMDLLKAQGAPDYVQVAGLFHAIYSTAKFHTKAASLDERAEIRKLIGEPAERLIYIFCASEHRPEAWLTRVEHPAPYDIKDRFDGSVIELSARDLFDLLTIELANLVEQRNIQMVPQICEALTRLKK